MISSTNKTIDCLYKNSNEEQISALHKSIKVKVYNAEGKVELVSAYNFHPDQTNWWKKLIHWLVELIWGKQLFW